MGTRFGDYEFMFDKWRWSKTLKALPEADYAACQELSGLTAGGWYHWIYPEKSKTYLHPGMLHFLQVCALLRLDPRDFFCLNVKEGE